METAGVTCARLLVAPSPAEADDAAARIESGEDFATVFEDVNIDPSLDGVAGDAGCFDINQVVAPGTDPSPEVSALLRVDAADPIATAVTASADGSEAGLLIEYKDAEELSDEDLVAVLDMVRQFGGVGLVLDGIDIHVDSRYGTFDRATGSVVPLL